MAKLDIEIVEGASITLTGWLVGDVRVYGLYPLESDLWNGRKPCINVWADDEVIEAAKGFEDRRLRITGTINHLSYLAKRNVLVGSAAFCHSDTYFVAEHIETAD